MKLRIIYLFLAVLAISPMYSQNPDLKDNPRLVRDYTVFAEVVEGMDVVDGILEGDVIEIGLPYSDPVMDGPTIQAAAQQALDAGTRTTDVLRVVEAVADTGVAVGTIVALGSAILGGVSGGLGSLAVLRKQSLLGDAISHAALPGVALAFLLGGRSPLLLVLGGAVAGWVALVLVGVAVVPAVRVACAGVRARIATLTERLPSGDAVAGVKLTLLPRRAKAAASRGSETAGVKAPIERPLRETEGRDDDLSRSAETARAGTSRRETAVNDAPPATAMAFNLFTRATPLWNRYLVRLVRHSYGQAAAHILNRFALLQHSHNRANPRAQRSAAGGSSRETRLAACAALSITAVETTYPRNCFDGSHCDLRTGGWLRLLSRRMPGHPR
mgnify:CR=1 FL=1